MQLITEPCWKAERQVHLSQGGRKIKIFVEDDAAYNCRQTSASSFKHNVLRSIYVGCGDRVFSGNIFERDPDLLVCCHHMSPPLTLQLSPTPSSYSLASPTTSLFLSFTLSPVFDSQLTSIFYPLAIDVLQVKFARESLTSSFCASPLHIKFHFK